MITYFRNTKPKVKFRLFSIILINTINVINIKLLSYLYHINKSRYRLSTLRINKMITFKKTERMKNDK